MKQIITIISIFCCISISAQDRTPIDKICEEISHVKDFINIPIKHKINNGDGVVVYTQNNMIGKNILCSKDCNGKDAESAIDSINEENEKVFNEAFDAIKHNLDSLMHTAEESYHYEYLNSGNDTIIYSLCLKNGTDYIRKFKTEDGTMYYPDAIETVTLTFTSGYKPCGKHIKGVGWFNYHKNVYLSDRKSIYFEKAPYLGKIVPVLNKKDVKSWDFRWSYSDDYDMESNRFKEFACYERISNNGISDSKACTGQVQGKMYFIPRERKNLAEALFTSVDSITLDHTNVFPQQRFVYTYNQKEWLMEYIEGNDLTTMLITTMLRAATGEENTEMRVLFGVSQEGYYIAVADVKDFFCIPKEWYKLKSFADGKKKYVIIK